LDIAYGSLIILFINGLIDLKKGQTMTTHISFNRPFVTGREFEYIQQAVDKKHLSGNGDFTKHCQAWLE